MVPEQILNAIARDHQVICLCGSTRFLAEFLVYQAAFTKLGCVVLSIGCVLNDKDGQNAEMGEKLDIVHKSKIGASSAVFVLDPGGYVGSSTRSEIEYARKYGKTVVYLSSIKPDDEPMDLEDALREAYCINAFVKYDEDAGNYVPELEVRR